MTDSPFRHERVGTQALEQADLQEAHRALLSTLRKCEKVLPKLREGTAQHTLLSRRIRALEIALVLIEEKHDSL